MLRGYINPEENKSANRQLPRLMVEGLVMGGAGLGVLALIFEIAADAFSVAAYQTLLAIHGAEGHHEIAIYAFIVLSVLLFLGIVPAYKAGAYLRPNAGGSGPLVEAIGPEKMRWLSWIGTSLFFLDAILTIIISSISAADVTMLLLPEWAPYRIFLAEIFAFFIMAVLVLMGPQKAVPLFLAGGGAFTIFTLGALAMVGSAAAGNPNWSFLTEGIVSRLQDTGVVQEVIQAQETFASIGKVLFFQLFFHSMSSAMLGFSGYEVIPASGKHAARPKWKVINTALTLAAIFLISTGMVQLYAAKQWKIPATEGYSTLLIEYEIIAAQKLGNGINEDEITLIPEDLVIAQARYTKLHTAVAHIESLGEGETHEDPLLALSEAEYLDKVSQDVALERFLGSATVGTLGEKFLTTAGFLLAFILLLAQGGGYVGGAAVAANAARLGRLPHVFSDDRVGISVIWVISALFIPVIREVVVVESYYAFGFVSAFVITSTTVFFVRDDVLQTRGIEPGSSEAKSLKFAGFRGMLASYFMGIVLITQKTDALLVITIAGVLITMYQLYTAHRSLNLSWLTKSVKAPKFPAGTIDPTYSRGIEQAHDEARQRGVVDAVEEIFALDRFGKFNVAPRRIRNLIQYLYNVDPKWFEAKLAEHEHGHVEEPNLQLEATYQHAHNLNSIMRRIEKYSHYGIFMFINNYHLNWVDETHGRDHTVVQKAMLDILFPLTDNDEIWEEFQAFEPKRQPEPIWQFSRERYVWAKDQWPNLSDRITTIWTLQDFGLISKDIDVEMVISVAGDKPFQRVKIQVSNKNDEDDDNPLEVEVLDE